MLRAVILPQPVRRLLVTPCDLSGLLSMTPLALWSARGRQLSALLRALVYTRQAVY
jgi:hypothetical protein